MIQPITLDLYEVLVSWWKSYGWPIPEKNILPQRGYVSFIGDRPIGAGFFYKDETADFGLMDFIVCNPDSTSEERAQAIAEVEGHIREAAKSLGVSAVLTISYTTKLTEKLEVAGYSRLKDPNMAVLLLKI